MGTHETAVALFNFIRKFDWGSGKKPKQRLKDVQTLLDILTTIGFQSMGVVWGREHTDCLLPFQITDEVGKGSTHISGWLIQAIEGAKEYKKPEEAIEYLKNIIMVSAPLEPIQLTSDGDFMVSLQEHPFEPRIDRCDFHHPTKTDWSWLKRKK